MQSLVRDICLAIGSGIVAVAITTPIVLELNPGSPESQPETTSEELLQSGYQWSPNPTWDDPILGLDDLPLIVPGVTRADHEHE